MDTQFFKDKLIHMVLASYICNEFIIIGHDITVKIADKCKESTTKCVGMLKKWSSKWECYIDVTRLSKIVEGDRLTVVIAENVEKSSISQEQVGKNLYIASYAYV